LEDVIRGRSEYKEDPQIKMEISNLQNRQNDQDMKLNAFRADVNNVMKLLNQVQSELLDNTIEFSNLQKTLETRGLSSQEAEKGKGVIESNLQVQDEKQKSLDEIKEAPIQTQNRGDLLEDIRRGRTLKRTLPATPPVRQLTLNPESAEVQSMLDRVRSRRSSIEGTDAETSEENAFE
jgi:hypothetical protein